MTFSRGVQTPEDTMHMLGNPSLYRLVTLVTHHLIGQLTNRKLIIAHTDCHVLDGDRSFGDILPPGSELYRPSALTGRMYVTWSSTYILTVNGSLCEDQLLVYSAILIHLYTTFLLFA